ncbi:transporter [Arthrobacter sp. Leaf141]|uniref:RDD family protein n=1 Tax=Arthrobacter sp. Leaf141 TaxID=1736273 RepID=UPI0006F260BE|nr:RDD family protein [Arthrobacter sp. Leaf141]KQR00626.1 transporter [Arthrobacter sp. Leaf141]
MAVNLQLVPATAGKRLGAAVTDWLFPLVVPAVLFSIGFAGVTRTRSGGFITYDTGSVVLFGGIGTGLALVYLFVLLGLEARTGKTPGNLLLGIRSADNDGYAPGAGPVFLRSIITGAGAVLVLIAAVLVVVFKWFDAALLILGPLQLLAAVWAVLVVISNRWDKNGGVRGWHDAAAKTLVFDVKAGRNPITSGGIQGPYSFAPLDLPPVQQVQSPVAGVRPASGAVVQAPAAPTAQPQPPLAQPAASRPAQPAASQPAAPIQPAASQPAAPVQPAPFAPAGPHAAAAPAGSHGPAGSGFQGHPDDDVERTQIRHGAAAAGTAAPAPAAVLRVRLDDGRDFQLDRNVLVGRNPVGSAGEQHAQLLAVDDPGRSISKTHLHLLTDGAGVWVTDRNSTNGSAVTAPDGRRTPLAPGVPTFVTPGSGIHFGDRTFYLGQA